MSVSGQVALSTVFLALGCARTAGSAPGPASSDPNQSTRSAAVVASASPVGAASVSAPSSGCSKAPLPSGERTMMVNGRSGLFIVSVPASYDVNKRYPLGFAFHGRNRNHQNCQQTDCAGFQTALGEQAVLVYMQSLREPNVTESGWEHPDEREDNVKFFEQVQTQLKSDYCIDDKRVFLAGTSSGASFANLLACRYGDQLLAVAPVSGGLPETQNCKGSPAALVIHGIDDPHVPFTAGERARDHYVTRAGCAPQTSPPLATMHVGVREKRDHKPSIETAECVAYEGCRAGSPVRWCEHSYGGYDGSTHGWPPVGGDLIRQFVDSL